MTDMEGEGLRYIYSYIYKKRILTFYKRFGV